MIDQNVEQFNPFEITKNLLRLIFKDIAEFNTKYTKTDKEPFLWEH